MLIVRAKKNSDVYVGERRIHVRDHAQGYVNLAVTLQRGDRLVIQREDGSVADVTIAHAESQRRGHAALAIDAPRSVPISRQPGVPSTPTTEVGLPQPDNWEKEYEMWIKEQ